MVRGWEFSTNTRSRWSARGTLAVSCALLVAAATACDAGAEQRTLRDSGLACIEMPASRGADCQARRIDADVPLKVQVDFGTCTSSSCDRVLNAECRARRSGSIITIEAESVIESEGSECTDDCGSVTATCELEPLPAGTYELRYGGDSTSLTVPSNTAAGCAGGDAFGRCCDTSDDCGGGSCENHRCR